MALSPFFRLPYAIPGVTSYLDSAAVSDMFPTQYELSAQEHWQFGTDNPNMVGRMNGTRLSRGVSFTVTNGGGGYTSAPAVTLTGGDGVGMTATAKIASGVVTSVTVDNPGTTPYTVPPAVSFSGGGAGAGAAATAVIGTAPTQQSGYLQTAGGVSGLITPYSEANEQTICVVVQVNPGNPRQIVVGNVTSDATVGGTCVTHELADYKAITRSNVPTGTLARPAGLVNNQSWVFIALSHSAGKRVALVGGAAADVQTTGVRTFSTPPRRLTLGNVFYEGSFESEVKLAEAVYFTRAMTEADLNKVYARAKTRCATRGITVA